MSSLTKTKADLVAEFRTAEIMVAARDVSLAYDGRPVLSGVGLSVRRNEVVTLIGLTLPHLLSGAVILEQIFTWPGMGRLFVNAIQWLKRQPISWVQAWPFPYQSAATLNGIGEQQVGNLARAWQVLKAEGVPTTFFVRPEAAAANSSLLREVQNSGRGSVGVLDDLLYAEDGSQEFQRQRLTEQLEAM